MTGRTEGLLHPRPQRVLLAPGSLELRGGGIAITPHDPRLETSARRVRRSLSEAGIAVADPSPDLPGVHLGISSELRRSPEHHLLVVDSDGLRIEAATPAGAFRGASTLAQWIRGHADEPGRLRLPAVRIEDWPDVATRGVMWDVSRDKVPRLETLTHLVDRLAEWKVNQIQLYLEHAFAYRGHEVVWRDASPLTADDVRTLRDACRERHVDLVPNQNSFGHLHRWLVHEPYRRLAECPEGVEHPFSRTVEPFSLCPSDPGSLELLADLYDQLLPLFDGDLVNVGLDETFDLGRGRSRAECAARGKHRVYLDFLVAVRELVAARGRRMQFWGDIVLERPHLVEELPRDVMPLAWGYEATHPFDDQAARLAASGLDYYVCPGTSSWNSLGGRATNALLNLSSAARAAVQHGAAGMLVTDWGDFGHLQPLPVSALGLLAGAGFAWNASTARDPDLASHAALLSLHAFDDVAGELGEAAVALGEAYRAAGPTPANGSVLFWLLLFADGSLDERRLRGLTPHGLRQAREHVEEAMSRLTRARPARSDGATAVDELRWVGELLVFACHLGLARLETGARASSGDLPASRRLELADHLSPLVERHRAVWLARNRPGGRADSVRHLERIADVLRG